MQYFEELKRSMVWLGKKNKTLFIGQAIEYPGTAMYNTLSNVKKDKLMEMPVAEELQMGITLGMSMAGNVVISIYPRWNFLLCALNQLVNHIDKFPDMAPNWRKENIIIRTSVGSERPLNPQKQHIGDFSSPIQNMLENVKIINLKEPEDIFKNYQKAFKAKKGTTTILVEYGDFYNEK